MRAIPSFLIGAIFGLGIMFGGMIDPAKVLNFFDIAGTWDPSLIFVMGGALITTFIGYRIVFARQDKPVIADAFQVPTNRVIDARLILGSAVFGIGWGMTGFCPGGVVPAIGLMRIEPVLFVLALLVGRWLAGKADRAITALH